MPTISVIVPVYNTEEYLRRCVDSILAQTVTDFELILVDDGSTDSSGAICDEYAEKDNRIKVIHKENGGLSSARNAGLEAAGGEFILFCDSDDSVNEIWCETMLSVITQCPDGFVVCDVNRLSDKESIQSVAIPYNPPLIKTSYYKIYIMGLSGYAVNKIYDNKTIQAYNMRFDETTYFAEDVAFNVNYALHCRECMFVSAKLYNYYQNEGSIMHRYYPDLLALNLPLFSCRLPLIMESDLQEFCDSYFFQFYHMFDVVFDERNKEMTFPAKMRYNQKMLCSEEFQFCLNHAALENENPVFVSIMKRKNYYLLWLVQRLYRIKKKIGGKKT